MKTLTNESKARFFAQYWGTGYIAIETKKPTDASVRVENVLCCQYTSNYHLELTHLQNISDEHAIEVAKFSGWDVKNHIEYSLKRIKEQLKNNKNDILISLFSFQFLQSKSYALDYFCPIENRIIPVQEQIDNGWITLKTE